MCALDYRAGQLIANRSAEACPKPDCSGYPLMTRGAISFCVGCDPLPDAPAAMPRAGPAQPSQMSPLLNGHDDADSETVSVINVEPVATALSSPPTTAPSSPALHGPAPVDLARRAQSDLASREIGRLLLQGWTLLADECPNPTCFGVPLVRRPKPRALPTEASAAPGTSTNDVASNVSKRRFGSRTAPSPIVEAALRQDMRKLCVICGQDYLAATDAPVLPTPAAPQAPQKRVHDELEPSLAPHTPTAGPSTVRPQKLKSRATDAALSNRPVTSLRQALHVLSDDLDSLVSAPVRSAQAIGDVADALGKVASALKAVQSL